MRLPTGLFLFLCGCSGLLLAGCAADEEKGLCSYLGGCGESDCEGDDCDSGVTAPAIGKGPSHDHDTTDHGAVGGHDESGDH